MPETSKKEIKLFYCYAREDKALRDQLEKHLAPLRRQYRLTNWHDREILPGEDWEQTIDHHLSTAHLVLLLISPDFMASDYCYGIEMEKALEQEKAGTCRVIPLLLRPTDIEDAPFIHLQMLPTDVHPLTSWPDRDLAFLDVATGIRKAFKDLLLALKTKEEWFEEGNALYSLKRYEEALTAYEKAIRLDPNDPTYHVNKGNALLSLKRYEEALTAYEEAIRLNPNNDLYHLHKNIALRNLKQSPRG